MYAPLDVLYVWPVQTPTKDFSLLYTTAKFKDERRDLASAEYQYGVLNVNLETGETEAREFGPLTEIYFTGIRSPKDRNILFGVLNRLAKYDIAAQKLIAAAELDHEVTFRIYDDFLPIAFEFPRGECTPRKPP